MNTKKEKQDYLSVRVFGRPSVSQVCATPSWILSKMLAFVTHFFQFYTGVLKGVFLCPKNDIKVNVVVSINMFSLIFLPSTCTSIELLFSLLSFCSQSMEFLKLLLDCAQGYEKTY